MKPLIEQLVDEYLAFKVGLAPKGRPGARDLIVEALKGIAS